MRQILLLAALLVGPLEGAPIAVKYVADGAIYLSAGRNAGLSAGMKLEIRRDTQPIAEVEVTSVAAASAACEIRSSNGPVQAGDLAYLSAEDEQTVETLKASGEARRYAQVVSFTNSDPLEEEAREAVPKPPLPEINRLRGQIGFEYSSIHDRSGTGLTSNDLGMVFRGDFTRIGGSYWSLSGYWRGRQNRQGGPQQQTLTDLLNRTYHLTLSYNNPHSNYVMGVGRLYLPWATSLDTIDGGYFARRFGGHVTSGIFAGTTPDPTSWNYNPDRQIAGAFTSYENGSYESLHYTSTAGVAFTRVASRPERQFAFFENTFSYQHAVTLYHTIQVDNYRPSLIPDNKGIGVSQSFLTLRLQPARIFSIDFSHNYFRNTPTFDPRLIGTGLLDKLLFQGLSGGFRLDLPHSLTVMANLGKSDRKGDSKSSWNQMYGLTVRQIWNTGVRADLRYSKFASDFGQGSYRMVLLSRQLGETLRFDLQAGDQTYRSTLTRQSWGRWMTASLDWFLASRYVLGGGVTTYRGNVQGYDQVYVNLGYRF